MTQKQQNTYFQILPFKDLTPVASWFQGLMFYKSWIFNFSKTYQYTVVVPAFSHFTHDWHLSIYIK